MALTAGNVLNDRVRVWLDDTDAATESRRWAQADLRTMLNDAVRDLLGSRPDLMIDGNGDVITIADATTDDSALNAPEKAANALACFVTAKALMVPGKDRQNVEASASYMALYEKAVKTL
jgi:hypothetical protein